MKFIVVAYDIPEDRKRTLLHKTLRRYGEPVQYSVFECILDEARFEEMRAAVNKVAGEAVDNVRYYELCSKCQGQIVPVGKAVTTKLQPFYLF